MKTTIVLLLVVINIVSTYSQSLTIFGANTNDFPLVKANIYIRDIKGNIIHNVTPLNFKVTEEGIEKKVINVTCPPEGVPIKLSSVLTVDVSGSMVNGYPFINMDIAKSAARKWITLIPDDSSECALTSFDCESYLNIDFTTDKSRLNAIISSLKPVGCTNYDAAFTKGAGAALNVIKRGKYKRVVVFLTDGKGIGDIEEVIRQAAAENTEIYCVGVNFALPDQIKDLAVKTNGAWFENINSPEKIEEIYERIFELARSALPCELVWETDVKCLANRTATIEYNSPTLKKDISYSVHEKYLPTISLSSLSAKFTNIVPGNSDTQDITITAETDSVIINTITSADPTFSIENGPMPVWILNKGETKTFTIRFVPPDSSLVFTKIQVSGNLCKDAIMYVMGGYTKVKKPSAILSVITPNGGEKFPSGDTTTLRWTGVLPNDTVKLDYSTDSGVTWLNIAERATGLSYLWTIPPTPSNRCKFRVQQFKNRVTDSLIFLKGHSKAVNEACFNPDGTKAVTVSGDRTFIVWNAITGLPEGSPHLIQDNTAGFCVDWNESSKQIVIGGNLGAGLYNDTSYNYLESVSPPTLTSTYSCAFSIDGKYVVTTGGSSLNSVIIWSQKDKQTISVPITNSEYLTRINISRSNTTHITALLASNDTNTHRVEIDIDTTTSAFAVTSSVKTKDLTSYSDCVAYVGNPNFPDTMCAAFENGQIQFFPSSPPIVLRLFEGDPINDIDWSPDGKFIAVALKSGRLAVIDVANQRISKRLDTVKAEAVSIRWDVYSSKVIASYLNNIALIWQVEESIEQQDISDSLWEIVSPNISNVKEVDFGRVVLNTSRDSVVNSILCITQNPLSFLKLDSAVIINDADSVFDIISGVPADFPSTLPACIAVELRFTPKKIGYAIATLQLFSNGQIFEIPLIGIGIDNQIKYPEQIIDFGKILVGKYKDTLIYPSTINLSSQSLNINQTIVSGPDTDQFIIIGGDTTISLNFQDTASLQLRFAPIYSGRTSSRVKINFTHQGQNDVGSPIYLTLFGEGTCGNNDKRVVRVNLGSEIPVVVGAVVEIPIKIQLQPGQDIDELASRFYCSISFDASMLYPLYPLPTGKIIGNKRIIGIEGERLTNSDTLIIIRLLTMLGSDSIATIHVDSLFVEDGGCFFTFEADSVSLKFMDICKAGGATRLLSESPITQMILLPNPSDGDANILFTLSEDSPITLILSDALGRELFIQKGNYINGTHHHRFECGQLSAGIYSLVLSTRSEVKFLQFIKR